MRKIYISYIATISILSLVYINNTSALDYSSNVGIGFTFNPTLSVSLSSSDLVIPNLIPGSTLDSNSINVSVATNAAYGYTLSANVNNENLVHSSNIDTFSSIDLSANLETLTADNTWGYTSKLSNETIWNNYNGLSSSSNAILLDNSNIADSSGSVDFKIAAKAGNTQPSGKYTGTINFIAVTKLAPMSLLDSFIASGAEQLNGYFKMQDMTHSICSNVDIEESELQLIDVRDNKVYWVAKLKDGNCWMTQNLELDLVANSTILNSTNTDISVESYNPESGAYSPAGGYSKDNNTNIVTWSPVRSTTTSLSNGNFPNTTEANYTPYSYNPGDKYYYPNNSLNINSGNDFSYTLAVCEAQGYTDCDRYKASNYYNWSASVASNNTSPYIGNNIDADNSLCSKGWRLPKKSVNEFQKLVNAYNITATNALDLRKKPLYFVRSGYAAGGSLIVSSSRGLYWSSTVSSSDNAYDLYFFNNNLYPASNLSRRYGFPIRCVAE